MALKPLVLILALSGCAGQQAASPYPEWFDPINEKATCIAKPADCRIAIWSVWDEMTKRPEYEGRLAFLGMIQVSRDTPHWAVKDDVRFQDVPENVKVMARQRACQIGADILVYLEGVPGSSLTIKSTTVVPAQAYKWRAYKVKN